MGICDDPAKNEDPKCQDFDTKSPTPRLSTF